MDPLIELLLAGGGSYLVLESAAAQAAWGDWMDAMDDDDPATRTQVDLPMDVKLYGLAVAGDGRSEPDYVLRPSQTGKVTVTVDGKGNFVSDIRVNAGLAQAQTLVGRDQYQVSFDVQAGQAYRVALNEAASDAGLYSIVARRQARQTPPSSQGSAQIAPVPTLGGGGLAALVCCAGWLGRRHWKRRGRQVRRAQV